MAAQGALPLKPSDLVELLHFLLLDPEADIRDAASATLASLPMDELLALVRDKETLPQVLAWALQQRREREILEVVLQNPSLEDHAIEAAAPTLSTELAELVVINQMRLLRRTPLLEAVESNPYLNNDQKRRLRELRETFHIGEQPAPKATPPPSPPPAPPPAEIEVEPEPDLDPLAERRGSGGPLSFRGGARPDRQGQRRPEPLPAQHGREGHHRPQGEPGRARHPRSGSQPHRVDRRPRESRGSPRPRSSPSPR